MMEFLTVFLILVCAHFICDFPLQGDFVAKFKARTIDGKHNPIWVWVLTAHAAAHALPTLLLTKSLVLASVVFITHWIIDLSKCEGRITFNQDQTYHLVVILSVSLMWWFV